MQQQASVINNVQILSI